MGMLRNAGPRRSHAHACRRITWLQLDTAGHKSYHAADKRALCQRKGLRLPVSDLRVLDRTYAKRGAILVRDKCIVVVLEHVRLIVMRDCVLLPLERSIVLAEPQSSLVAALVKQIREYQAHEGGAVGAVLPAAPTRARVVRGLLRRRLDWPLLARRRANPDATQR